MHGFQHLSWFSLQRSSWNAHGSLIVGLFAQEDMETRQGL
jgi:hypothetical protein